MGNIDPVGKEMLDRYADWLREMSPAQREAYAEWTKDHREVTVKKRDK